MNTANDLHMKPAKPVLAYLVSNDDPECDTIQFATSNVAARRQGANEIDDDFAGVSCKRLQWADEYRGQHIPAQAYIEHGWRVSCTNCGDYVSEESYRVDDDGEDVPHEPVYRGTHVFCCPSCESSHDAEVSTRNAAFEAFKETVTQARPDLTFTKFTGEYPCITLIAKFTFPGGQYGGSVRDQEGDGTLAWFIAHGDKAAWDLCESARATA